jgi:hypothetical protein
MLIKILELLKKYWKLALALAFAGVVAFKVHGCDKKHMQPPTQVVLPPKDKEQIIVKNNEVTVITQKGTTVTNGSRGVTIDVKKDGSVVVTPKTHGFVLNPMLGAGINSTGPKITVGAEVYYYKKLDLLVGIGADKYIANTVGFAGIGYTPESKWIHNTSFYVGYASNHSVMAGFAIRI